ncbi:hypothetical protein B484DRAFT_476193 [Ochromonadaceae sp. CCMP2298]|nr:hypothetical protein B484DRAFT_476193 [Ochromonadaceae sp. CCMP2298]
MTKLIHRDIKANTALVHRHLSHSSIEQMETRQMRSVFATLITLRSISEDGLSRENEGLFELMITRYQQAILSNQFPDRVRHDAVPIVIADVPDGTCYARCLFRKDDLYRLLRALRLQEAAGAGRITMSNGAKFGTQEILLLSLHKLIAPMRRVVFIDLVQFYGRDWTALSRAYNWFMHYVRTEFAHLVQDSWAYWRPDLETFTEKIRITMEEKSGGGIVYPPGGLAVFGFIDDTTVRTTRVGGEPAEPGPNALRFNTLVQMGFYSGYKKIHGVPRSRTSG